MTSCTSFGLPGLPTSTIVDCSFCRHTGRRFSALAMADDQEHTDLRTAIAALKDINPALTARRVHDALVASAECWKELPLASVKKMCSKMTKAAAAASAGATATPMAADTGGIDPTALPAWVGLDSVPPRRADGTECRPLEWCFQAAMPQTAKIALSLGGDEGTMDGYAQMVYSLFHIVHTYESTPSMYRAALETRDGGAALLIDVLQPPCACPAAVEACRVGSGDTAAPPLLSVRYLHVPGAAELRALPPDEAAAAAEARVQAARQTMAPTCPHATAALLAKGAQPPGVMTTIEAASADEIDEALRLLRANEAALAPAYAARFFEGSRWHDTESGLFRPSFLVPPVAPLGAGAESAHERGGDAPPRRKYKTAVLL